MAVFEAVILTVGVIEGVILTVGVTVGVALGEAPGVLVIVGVIVGVIVMVGVTVVVGVGDLVGVTVGVTVGVGVLVAAAQLSKKVINDKSVPSAPGLGLPMSIKLLSLKLQVPPRSVSSIQPSMNSPPI